VSQARRRQDRPASRSLHLIDRRWPLHSTSRPRRGEVQYRLAELSIGRVRGRRFESRNARRFFIGVHNETLAVTVCINNLKSHLCSRGRRPRLFLDTTKPRPVCSRCFWIFAYSVHSRSGQPLSSLLSKLGGIPEALRPLPVNEKSPAHDR
jgi:hypothetical protein